ncbi:MAG: hypothetical protein DMG58_25940 [Acidobacteria bacterium]|nr:MAG: hypothetical protein DMG58_25940 [Acidobacteriota bacterium]
MKDGRLGEKVSKKMLFRLGIAVLLAIAPYGRAEEAKQNGSEPQTPAATASTGMPGQEAAGHPGLKQRNPRYQLCKNDVLELTLPMTPEFNQTVTVQPDGYITLLGAGDLHVEGQTIPELIQSVRSAYRGTLHDPVITIHLKDFEKPYFIAGGEVGHPGSSGWFHGVLETLSGLGFPPGFKRLGRNQGAQRKEDAQRREPTRRHAPESRRHAVRAQEHDGEDQALSPCRQSRDVFQSNAITAPGDKEPLGGLSWTT